MSPDKALVIVTVVAFAALALTHQAIRLWQQADQTITDALADTSGPDALHEDDEEVTS